VFSETFFTVCQAAVVENRHMLNTLAPPDATVTAWLLPLSLLVTAAVAVWAIALLLRGQRLLRRVRDTEARYQVFYELAPVAMVVHDQQHRIIDWNRAAERLFGWAREEALGRDFFDLLGPGGALPDLRHAVDETLKTTVRSSTMNWSQRADGTRLLCDWSNAVIKDAGGQVDAVVSLAQDVTATREFERRLRSSERRFRSLAENAWDVIWTAGLDGQVTYASPSVERMLGYSPETVRQGRIYDVLAPDVAAQVRQALEELRTRGTPPPRQWEVAQRTHDGRTIWAQVTMEVLRGDNGAPREILGITRDITEQRAVQEALRSRMTAIESAAEGVIITDLEGRIEYVNPAYVELTGQSAESAFGRLPDALADPYGEARELAREILACVRRGEVGRGEIAGWHPEEPTRVAAVTVSPVIGEDGQPLRLVAMVRDISERKALEARLTELAHSDPLTGLPNRRLFFDRLEERLRMARRQDRPLALLFLDLDGFKTVNDRYGHAVGDEVLQAVATRFRAALRESDSLSRVAGDEFTVLLGPSPEALAPEEVASKLIDALRVPVRVQGAECQLGVSIGIAHFPADAEEADALLRCADQAMYVAKRGGRSRFVVHGASQIALPASATGQ
jgi:diguanylate cyclase (GGDEF)-like protein/PAS domain S-box-containing protein